ncbi:hypothetical protein [Nocardioides jejuensis]|uniref:Uncharacterized protein n=1 Tax=Nocardioides jejuensis TaxID=2502782 RepID=A0A4R1CJT6_9ACTN|nr:hypothetical protein [Nocardioides jejuensis]TCJ30446.1 hypothetical protein EPD65_04405 [Nocardioides jejuensis]
MEIPTLLPPDQMPPIVDQASLEHHWRALMGKLGFGRPRVWVLLIQRSRGLMVSEVDELPLRPEDDAASGLRHVFGSFDGVEPAFLYCRPGSSALSAADRAWVDVLVAASDAWPVHVANDVELRVVAPDDLI